MCAMLSVEKGQNMKKESARKVENVFVASVAATVGFFIAFFRCWAIPVRSAAAARRIVKNEDADFLMVYNEEYDRMLYDNAKIPMKLYHKYKAKMESRQR